MAKNYNWTEKGVTIPELPASSQSNLQYKLCAQKNPAGVVQYYWKEDIIQLLPRFTPCTEDYYNATYKPTYGMIGSMVNVLTNNETEVIDRVYLCRVVQVTYSSPEVQAGAFPKYSDIVLCQAGQISVTGYMNAGVSFDTIPTNYVGLIMTNGL